MSKCTEWEIHLIQDPSTIHSTNYLTAFAHEVCTEKITLKGPVHSTENGAGISIPLSSACMHTTGWHDCKISMNMYFGSMLER